MDYASSDDEDTSIKEGLPQPSKQPSSTAIATSSTDGHQHQSTPPSLPPQPTSSQAFGRHSQSTTSLDQQSQDVSPLLPPPIEKLPDASFLLSSPILSQTAGSDHSSRVAAAMAENASRKREAYGSSSSYIRGKIPRSNLPHSKNIPDTGSGLLVPPQLGGRSNVVTEDINKLFVKKNLKESHNS